MAFSEVKAAGGAGSFREDEKFVFFFFTWKFELPIRHVRGQLDSQA